ALLVVVGVQLRGLLNGCTVEDLVELSALLAAVTTSVALLAWASARPRHIAAVQRCAHRVATVVRRAAGRSAHAPPPPTSPPAIALSSRAWAAVALLAVLNWAADGAVLAVSVVAVGAHPHW